VRARLGFIVDPTVTTIELGDETQEAKVRGIQMTGELSNLIPECVKIASVFRSVFHGVESLL